MNPYPYLPADILPDIFSNLPLEDRKNVRLSCRLWNDACNRQSILKKEKFTFHLGLFGWHDMLHMGSFILKCKNLRPNWEFQGIYLFLLPLNVLEKCGPQIRTLSIRDCDMTDKTIEHIIRHCTNLRSFRLETTTHSTAKLTGFGNGKIFDKLIRQNIVRESLLSFRVHLKFLPSDDVCMKIYQIFPNIRTFGIYGWGEGEKHDRELTFPPMMKNFYCLLCTSCSSLNRFCESSRPMLQELNIKLRISNMHNIKKILSYQNELKTVKVNLCDFGTVHLPIAAKELLFHALEDLSQLKVFHFKAMCRIGFTISEFATFLRLLVHLEGFSLTVRHCYVQNLDQNLFTLPKIKYEKLNALYVDFRNEEAEKIQYEILSRCCFLECLGLNYVDGKVLKEIFQNQTRLKRLSIRGFKNETRTSCGKAEQQSNNQFVLENGAKFCRSLEFFEIFSRSELLVIDSVGYYSESIFFAPSSQFYFPKLKELLYSYNGTKFLSQNALVKNLSERAPSLRHLIILNQGQNVSSFKTSENCADGLSSDYWSNFKKLKLLDTFIAHRAEDVAKIFKDCPSLKCVRNRNPRVLKAIFYNLKNDKIDEYDFCKRLNPEYYFRSFMLC